MAKQYSWNSDTESYIVPACHGTNTTIGEKICETGFASLSSLDAGYFGKGIYFTSFSMYCTPYIAAKKAPMIIVSWLLPGNVYPVIEKVDGPDSLLGAAIKNGFNSHFVVTDRAGKCVNQGSELYNEIIISQESQIVPAFLISISKKSLKSSLKKWNRSVPTQTDVRRPELRETVEDGDPTIAGFSRVTLDSSRDSIGSGGILFSDITLLRNQQHQPMFGANKSKFESV